MSKIAVVAISAALTLSGGAAVAATQHAGTGCKVVSVKESGPAYTSPSDRTGVVTVVTTTKCKGRLTTQTTSYAVTR